MAILSIIDRVFPMEHTEVSHHRSLKQALVSIVAPAYNEEENLVLLYDRVLAVMTELGQNFEIVIVENGSTDHSIEILKKLHAKDSRLQFVSLSRNFGHQGGLLAGLTYSTGDVVISMDADLQHPPELFPKMLKLWENGYDIVYTIKRENHGQSRLRRVINFVFYSLLSKLSGLELTGGQSDFRLMDRKAVNALLQMPERNKFLRGLTRWIGFKQTGMEFDLPTRFAGKSKFRFGHLFRFALDGILSFSIIPLRVFTVAGFAISISALLYQTFIILDGLYAYYQGHYDRIPPGWVETAAAIFFFGGVQLLGIGLLGEYLGRVYDEVKCRPSFLVRESSLLANNRIGVNDNDT